MHDEMEKHHSYKEKRVSKAKGSSRLKMYVHTGSQ